MASIQEQITDQHLRDVFNDIKGTEGRHRAYINYDDFKRACLSVQPPCLEQMIHESVYRGSAADLNEQIEEHFRNICESCSPVFDKNDNEQSSPKVKNADDEDLLCDLGNASLDEGPKASMPAKKLKMKPLPQKLTN